jgi:hypothetical protein
MNTLIFLFVALGLLLQFWALIDIAFTKRMQNKSLWFLIVFAFPVIGSIFYFQGRDKIVREFNPKFSSNANKLNLLRK